MIEKYRRVTAVNQWFILIVIGCIAILANPIMAAEKEDKSTVTKWCYFGSNVGLDGKEVPGDECKCGSAQEMTQIFEAFPGSHPKEENGPDGKVNKITFSAMALGSTRNYFKGEAACVSALKALKESSVKADDLKRKQNAKKYE